MTILACQRSTPRLYSESSARRRACSPRALFQSPMSAHLGTGSRPSVEELDRPLRRTTQCIVSASPPSHRGGARLRGGPSSSARSGFICFRCAALTQTAPHKRGGSSVSDRPAPPRAGRLLFVEPRGIARPRQPGRATQKSCRARSQAGGPAPSRGERRAAPSWIVPPAGPTAQSQRLLHLQAVWPACGGGLPARAPAAFAVNDGLQPPGAWAGAPRGGASSPRGCRCGRLA